MLAAHQWLYWQLSLGWQRYLSACFDAHSSQAAPAAFLIPKAFNPFSVFVRNMADVGCRSDSDLTPLQKIQEALSLPVRDALVHSLARNLAREFLGSTSGSPFVV